MSCNGSSVYHLERESCSSGLQNELQEITNYAPVNYSCITHDTVDLRDKVWELETIMLGPDPCNFDTWNTPSGDLPDHMH